jgi:hypothetical protein
MTGVWSAGILAGRVPYHPAVMTDLLRDRLQSSLGAAYALERELGGGGMSRVFVAEDVALGRRIVVKVLAPSAGWSTRSRCATRTSTGSKITSPTTR